MIISSLIKYTPKIQISDTPPPLMLVIGSVNEPIHFIGSVSTLA